MHDTEPQSHYTGRTIHEKETVPRPDKTVLLRQEHSYKEKDVLRAEARNMRLFAKEFGQSVRQERVRDKTKKRSGTLPLALSTFQRIVSPRKDNVIDVIVIVELQALQWTNDNLKAQPESEKQYSEPFYLASPSRRPSSQHP